MKFFNVGIIGYGKMGRIYAKEIKKQKKFKLIDILKHQNLLKNPKIIEKFFKSKKINLFIISSPIDTHFEYLKYAYKSNKNIIIEKPLVENENQLRELIKLNKNYKKKVMIHHNDVINFEKINFMNNLQDFENIKKIDMVYGKKEIINTYRKPFFDWLPHPLSVIINFFGKPNNLKVIYYSKKIKNKLIVEKLKLILHLKNFPVILNFSNDLKLSSKTIIVHKNNKPKTYNGYSKINRRSVKLLLEKFYATKKINEININQSVYKLLFRIDKLIMKFNKT